jgi:hypothetical protein
MKKLLLTGSLIMASLALVSAQGTIKFNNTTATFYVSTNGTGTGSGENGTTTGVTDKTAAGDYYYALLYDTSTPSSANPSTGGWLATGLIGTNNTTLFAGGITGPGGANGTAVSQVAPGATAYFEVVGWSASLNGLSLTQMLAEYASGDWTATGYFGVSAPTTGALTLGGLGTPATLPPALFGGADGIQNGFDLNGVSPVVPEPGSIALAGLGGLALLGLRRKK